MTESKAKSWAIFGLFGGLLAALLVGFLSPTIVYQPRGLFLPVKAAPSLAPTQPNAVLLIAHFPTQYRTLGRINAEMHLKQNNLQEVRRLVQYVKRLAAARGADAVVGSLFKSEPQGPEKGMSAYVFRGTAIRAL